jgi:2-polyprenyl-3-methyl-5-hydroxy-6-metoxy-1,4-benzoquinol methylase
LKDNQWNKIADEYIASVRDEGDIYHKTYINPKVDILLGEVKGLNILDLACGNGYYSRKLAKKGAHVIGVDASDKLLLDAKQHEEKEKLGINYILTSSSKMNQISNKSQDIVLCHLALHDIRNLKDTISEVSRVLKKNGFFIFSIPHPCFFGGEKTHDQKGYYNRTEYYLSERSYKRPKFGNTFFYHRPLQSYINLLGEKFLYIQRIEEITTHLHSNGKLFKGPSQKLKLKKEIPSFLVVKAILYPSKSQN